MVIVHTLLDSVSCTSILFMGLVLLVPLIASSHIFIQGWSYLVSCIWVSAGWAGTVNTAGPPMSLVVALWFLPLSSCTFMVSWLLVYLPFTGPVKPVVALIAPKLSLVLELGSDKRLNGLWWGLPSPPCLPFLHMQVLAAHPQSLLGILFPVHDFLKPHTHGPTLLPSCVSDSACRIAKNGHWKPVRF